jgi:hypothetical protein
MVSNNNISEERLNNDQILINGEILTQGKFVTSIISNIEETNTGFKNQQITIKGELRTKYYIKELNELESIRYYVSGIFVTKESYMSNDDMIIYEFDAEYFKPKFQDTEYERIGKE